MGPCEIVWITDLIENMQNTFFCCGCVRRWVVFHICSMQYKAGFNFERYTSTNVTPLQAELVQHSSVITHHHICWSVLGPGAMNWKIKPVVRLCIAAAAADNISKMRLCSWEHETTRLTNFQRENIWDTKVRGRTEEADVQYFGGSSGEGERNSSTLCLMFLQYSTSTK